MRGKVVVFMDTKRGEHASRGGIIHVYVIYMYIYVYVLAHVGQLYQELEIPLGWERREKSGWRQKRRLIG